MLKAKKLGFSDVQLGELFKASEDEVRAYRLSLGIEPFVKQIDTLAAEYPAQTNYLYMTYHGSEHDITEKSNSHIVLGSGSYRIGSSVEFDWCGVSTIRTLRQVRQHGTIITCNVIS